MRFFINIFFLFFAFASLAQPENKYGIVEPVCSWDVMTLKKDYSPIKGDTCLFVVSTRNYDASKKEFLDNDYDTTKTLKYFAVYFNRNNWIAVPYSSLEEMLNNKSYFNNMILFTEGLGKTFIRGIDRATRLTQEYHTDVIFFDWSTERPNIQASKNISLTVALSEKIAIPYASFLEDFQAYKEKNNHKFKTVTVLFHSMGNLILMHDLQMDLFKNIRQNLVDNVVLNAACVPQKDHAIWLNKLHISKHIYVTVNDRDKNLNGAKLLFFAHQLGERPKGPFCKNVNYIDFSDVLDKQHNYFLMQPLLTQKPYLRDFYNNIFNGEVPQLKFVDTSISEEIRKYLPGRSENAIGSGL